ncbi:WPP domain-interacting protein 3 [Triticum aestivum]|nr:WPP domain-interacting protein 3-like [Triticum aestivum]
MAVTATDMDRMANGAVESSAESLAAEAPPEARTKGRGLRRWRRIQREHRAEGPAAPATDAGGRGGADDDAAQLHKRRLPLGPAAPPKGKHEVAVEKAESSTASVESRFVPLEQAPAPAPAKLDPDLGLLVCSVGFSVGAGGADSDNSEDRSSKSSTAASAPRHDFPRERDRLRAHTATSIHGKNHRTARARADRQSAHTAFSVAKAKADNSRSSVESDRRSSNAIHGRKQGVGSIGNDIHKELSDGDDHSDEGQPSDEMRSTAGGYCRQSGSNVVGKLGGGNGDSGDADVEDTCEEGGVVGKGEIGLEMNSCANPYAESILLLQRTQEALENEIRNFVVIGKESTDDLDARNDEWSNSLHIEESVEEANEKRKDLESRMEQASALIKEKDSRILELEALSRTRAWRSAIQSANNQLLQPDVDQLLQEKMEAEIQCIILTRASQTWTLVAEDRKALCEEQKCLLGDYKELELKLRSAENRAAILGEMVEKLEAQCKELSASAEILQLQSRTSTASLLCFSQFILLLIAVGIYVMRLSPSSTELVPT